MSSRQDKFTKQDEERRTRKLFIGGVSFSTTDEDFFQYFAKYGELEDCVLIREKNTGESRGFGFVTYKDKAVSDHVANQQLYLDGRRLDPKPSISRFSMDKIHEHRNQTTKVFVGGLHDDTAEAELSEHFTTFGEVLEINIMYDRFTNAPRGFGFVTFKEPDIADKVINWDQDHIIHGKKVDCKPATARKDAHGATHINDAKKPTSREERWRKYHGDTQEHSHGHPRDDYKRSIHSHSTPAHIDPYAHSSYAHHSAYSHAAHYPHSSYAHSSYPPPPQYGYGAPPTSSSSTAAPYGHAPPTGQPMYGHPHYDPYYRHYPPPPHAQTQAQQPPVHGASGGSEYKYAAPPPHYTHPPPTGHGQPRYDYYAQYPPPPNAQVGQSQSKGSVVAPVSGTGTGVVTTGNVNVKKDDKSGLVAPVKPIGSSGNSVQDGQSVQTSYGPSRGSKAISSAQGARYSSAPY